MKWIVRVYTWVLLAYTGYRTYDLLMANLPAGEISSVWLALLFLFASEIGLAIWHEVSVNHTSTYTQNGVAVVLTWVDFAGSLAAGIADMILRQNLMTYEIPPLLGTTIIYGLPVLVAGNVAGALVYLSNDAETVMRKEKRFLSMEAFDQAISELKDHRRNLVSQHKANIKATILDEAPTLPAQAPIDQKRIGANHNGNGRHYQSQAAEYINPTNPGRTRDTDKPIV